MEAIKVVGQILKSELNLADGQIMLGYQKWPIPIPGTLYGEGGYGDGSYDADLYIALTYISGKAISNSNYFIPNADDGLDEIQTVVMHYLIQLDFMSFGPSARVQKEEIVMALRSVFSERMQEENNLQIAMMPGEFVDAGSLEETAYLNRFTMPIAVTALTRKQKSIADIYTSFQTPEVFVNE